MENKGFLTILILIAVVGYGSLGYIADKRSKEMGKGYTRQDFVIDYYDRTGNYFARVRDSKGKYIKVSDRTGGMTIVMSVNDATIFRSFDETERAIDRFSTFAKPFTREPSFSKRGALEE